MAQTVRHEVAAPSSVKAQSARRPWDLLEKERVVVTLLLIWGLFVFYSSLGTALRGDEALYAAIARRIVRTGEWLPLEYQGQPYLNKPPLHFWLIALSLSVWGPTEFAVRFPSATFGIATMFFVYYCGKVLFHRRIGLVAALIATTTFSAVWNAHEARFDVELGFWMNLAVFAFYLAYRGGERRFGYLCLAFSAMAVGTMLKGPIGLLLPGASALVFLAITRRSKALMEIPFLAAGLAIFLLVTGPYHLLLGDMFNRHFFVSENLMRVFQGGKPALFYFYMIFANFFPWSLLLPSVGACLWRSRSRHPSEEGKLLLVWPIAFLLLLSLPAWKPERFLVYLIPPFALLVARYWEHLFADSEAVRSAENRLLRSTATLLALVTLVALFVGPRLIRVRYPIPTDFVPVPFALLISVGCVAVLYTALRMRPKGIFLGMMAVALAMTIALVQVFYPALARYNSAIPISQQVRAIVEDSPLVIFDPDTKFTYEILYYLDLPHPVPQYKTAEEFHAALRSGRQVFGLLAEDRLKEIERGGGVPLVQLGDYSYRKWRYVLVSNRDQS
jgi:4-amino-4-deoxy-L-arabinose transferase-like glycosyltransferase